MYAFLVELRRQHLSAHALVAALHCGGVLALALGGRLLVELAGAQLGEEPGLLDRALEAAESDVERLVFLDSDNGHRVSKACLARGITHNISILPLPKARARLPPQCSPSASK